MALKGFVAEQSFNLSDNRQFYAFIIASTLGGITSLAIATINMIGTRRARDAAEKVAEHVKPVGNGFAASVKASLERIERDLTESSAAIAIDLMRIETKVDHHIQAHADKEIHR